MSFHLPFVLAHESLPCILLRLGNLPIFEAEDRFCGPKEVRPMSDALAICGACPLFEGQVDSKVKTYLGWDGPPPLEMLETQLRRLREASYICFRKALMFATSANNHDSDVLHES